MAPQATDPEGPASPTSAGRGKSGHAKPGPASADAKPAALSQPQRALQRLGLVRDIDLALHLPLRYEDETRITSIGALREGHAALVQGCIRNAVVEQRRRPQLLLTIEDDSGRLALRFLHFYGTQQKAWVPGVWVRVLGEARRGMRGLEMVHPQMRVVDPDEPLAAQLTPVYPTTAGLPQAYLRKVIASALRRAPLQEVLPAHCLPASWPSLRVAVERLHQPPAGTALQATLEPSHPARQRLQFEELLAQQVSQLQARAARARLRAPVMRAASGGLHERLMQVLPFALTAAQARVGAEIAADLALGRPMHRLLQGDVGAGKTVVAALAAAIALDSGWQCALMVPTEILAEQHFRKLVAWLSPLGVQVAWLTGSLRAKDKREQVEAVAQGRAQLVVGTHAVIQDHVSFAKLGLVLIDEQHRFGVAQRLALRRKLDEAQLEPHLLMMTATPIPRTLAMACLADLDVSAIDELPPGRSPILTKVFSQARRAQVMATIREEVLKGRQVYWVCPLIDETEDQDNATEAAAGRPARARPALDLNTVTQTQLEIAQLLPDMEVGLLHGRLPSADKAAVMQRFAQGDCKVLVATTVIEVGVDVPNASLMVIDDAERFGLSQLHQLRGRVGRGSVASVCVLLYGDPLSDAGKQRLRAMAQTQDGFEIARLDLDIRGPGEFLGARQSGAALLRFADFERDHSLLSQAKALAQRLLEHEPQAARAHVQRWLGDKADYGKV